jgi:hypothetical protein
MVANGRGQMITPHFSDVAQQEWDWANFSPKELSCVCCGEYFSDGDAINRLQYARNIVGEPFKLNSAHRCGIHNARVGGAPRSQHKKLAFDVAVGRHDRRELLRSLQKAGFTTFGYYRSFIHTDTRPNRIWYSKGAKALWTS